MVLVQTEAESLEARGNVPKRDSATEGKMREGTHQAYALNNASLRGEADGNGLRISIIALPAVIATPDNTQKNYQNRLLSQFISDNNKNNTHENNMNHDTKNNNKPMLPLCLVHTTHSPATPLTPLNAIPTLLSSYLYPPSPLLPSMPCPPRFMDIATP
jgi:hypothetical protein